MIKIGLTGGIASGKSVVTQYLRDMGAPVFDADAASRRAVAKGTPGLQQVLQVLGSEYATPDGNLDRPRVAAKVFHDQAARKKLESVIHKIVWQEATAFMKQAAAQGSRVVFLDVSHSVEELPLRVMMSVSKKKFKKAVTRNRIKRLMREVYRLNKTELVNFASDEKIKIHVAFQYVADEILSFDEMNNKMIKVTDKLKRNLLENLKKTDENG